MELPVVLTKMRKIAGYTQEKMAHFMDMSRSNIAKLETGRIELKAEDLLKWCKITNNPDMLMKLYTATDVAMQVQPYLQPITGFIFRFGGLI